MITIARLRDALALDPTRDAELSLIRSQVIGGWEELTKMLWDERADHEEIFEPRGSQHDTLLLSLQPVTAISTVEVREAFDSGWTTLADTAYMQIGRRQLRRIDGFYWPELIRVTYDGGTDAADESIQAAMIIQARFMISRTDAGKIITKSQNFEGGAGVFESADWHPHFKALAELKKRKS